MKSPAPRRVRQESGVRDVQVCGPLVMYIGHHWTANHAVVDLLRPSLETISIFTTVCSMRKETSSPLHVALQLQFPAAPSLLKRI